MNPFIGFFVGFIQAVGVMLGFSHTPIVPNDQIPTPQQVVNQYGTLPHGLPNDSNAQSNNSNEDKCEKSECWGALGCGYYNCTRADGSTYIKYADNGDMSASDIAPASIRVTSADGAGPAHITFSYANLPQKTSAIAVCTATACTEWVEDFKPPLGSGTFTISTADGYPQSTKGLANGTYRLVVIGSSFSDQLLSSPLFTIPFASGGASSANQVPGMSKYTDSDFGFSFWYPSGWQQMTQDELRQLATPAHTIKDFSIESLDKKAIMRFMVLKLSDLKMADPNGDECVYYAYDPQTQKWFGHSYSDNYYCADDSTVASTTIQPSTLIIGKSVKAVGSLQMGDPKDYIVPIDKEYGLYIELINRSSTAPAIDPAAQKVIDSLETHF